MYELRFMNQAYAKSRISHSSNVKFGKMSSRIQYIFALFIDLSYHNFHFKYPLSLQKTILSFDYLSFINQSFQNLQTSSHHFRFCHSFILLFVITPFRKPQIHHSRFPHSSSCLLFVIQNLANFVPICK